MATSPSRRAIKDTLPEEVYQKAHRKAERHEKQLRNIEKERAQHEKVQLDRLLDELKGPDWLKVMGISGVTDSEKKLYEPKRSLFIKEVNALIAKFRHWKEEEKRRRVEREQLLSGDLEDDFESEAAADGDDEEEADDDDSDSDAEQESASPSGPDTSEMDAAAARQLHQEAIGASAFPARSQELPASTTTLSRQRPRKLSTLSGPRPISTPESHGSRSPHGRRRRGSIRGRGGRGGLAQIQTRQMSRTTARKDD